MLYFTHNEENANTIFHFSDWQKSRTLMIHSVALRKKALFYNAGETVNWLNSQGRQFGNIYQKFNCIYLLTLECNFWEFILQIHLHTCQMMTVPGYSLQHCLEQPQLETTQMSISRGQLNKLWFVLIMEYAAERKNVENLYEWVWRDCQDTV